MQGIAAHFCAAVLLISACVSATDVVSVPRTLLISNTLNITDTHSRFIKYLKATGRELDIREASDKDLRLRDWDTWLYSELVVFAPQADGDACSPLFTFCALAAHCTQAQSVMPLID